MRTRRQRRAHVEAVALERTLDHVAHRHLPYPTPDGRPWDWTQCTAFGVPVPQMTTAAKFPVHDEPIPFIRAFEHLMAGATFEGSPWWKTTPREASAEEMKDSMKRALGVGPYFDGPTEPQPLPEDIEITEVSVPVCTCHGGPNPDCPDHGEVVREMNARRALTER